MPYVQIRLCTDKASISNYMPHMNSVKSSMWLATLLCPLTNMPAIKHMYAPLHLLLQCMYKPHISTATNKKRKLTFIYHAISIYVEATNMPLKCHTYVTCIDKGCIPVYIPYVVTAIETVVCIMEHRQTDKQCIISWFSKSAKNHI